MVILPDHLHTVWMLPEGDADCLPLGEEWMLDCHNCKKVRRKTDCIFEENEFFGLILVTAVVHYFYNNSLIAEKINISI